MVKKWFYDIEIFSYSTIAIDRINWVVPMRPHRMMAQLAASLCVILAGSAWGTDVVSSDHPYKGGDREFSIHADFDGIDSAELDFDTLEVWVVAEEFIPVVITDLDASDNGYVEGWVNFPAWQPGHHSYEMGLSSGLYEIVAAACPIGGGDLVQILDLHFAVFVEPPTLSSAIAAGATAQYNGADVVAMPDVAVTGVFESAIGCDAVYGFGAGLSPIEYALDNGDYHALTWQDCFDDETGEFCVHLHGLSQGLHTVHFSVTDFAGNVTQSDYAFYTDPAPFVTFMDAFQHILHDGDIIGDATVLINAWFWCENGLSNESLANWQNFNYASNGIWSAPGGDKTWFFASTALSLNDEFTLTATAVGAHGLQTTVTIHLKFGAPAVIAVSPLNNTWVTTATPEIYAEFMGGVVNGTMTIDGYYREIEVANSRIYARNFSLADGVHAVEVVGTNQSGIYCMPYSWTVKVDTTPPVISSVGIADTLLSLSASDQTSGVSSVFLRIDGAVVREAFGATTTYDISGLAYGSHQIVIGMFDVAANYSKVKATLTVDENGALLGACDIDDILEAVIMRQTKANGTFKANELVENELWIGEKVLLSIQFNLDDITPTSFNWEISGHRVTDFNLDFEQGFVIEFDPHINEPSFAWWQGGGLESVSCTVDYLDEQNQTSGSKEAPTVSFFVHEPQVDFNIFDQVYYFEHPEYSTAWAYANGITFYHLDAGDPGAWVQLGNPDNGARAGITFAPRFNQVRSNEDRFFLLQTISAITRSAKNTKEQTQSMSFEMQVPLLDATPNSAFIGGGVLQVNQMGNVPPNDHPKSVLYREYTHYDQYVQFNTHLMYAPNCAEGIVPVPLKVCAWNLNFWADRRFTTPANVKVWDYSADSWMYGTDTSSWIDDITNATAFPEWCGTALSFTTPFFQ